MIEPSPELRTEVLVIKNPQCLLEMGKYAVDWILVWLMLRSLLQHPHRSFGA